MLRKIIVGSFCIWGCTGVFATDNLATTPAPQQQEGLTPEEKDELSRNGTKLFNAICSNQVGVVKKLLEAHRRGKFKLDINSPIENSDPRPPLHIAVTHETQEAREIINLLVTLGGANVNVEHDGRTPADVAARLRYVDNYEKLIELGGKIHERTRVIVYNMMDRPYFWYRSDPGDPKCIQLEELVKKTESIDKSVTAAGLPLKEDELYRNAEEQLQNEEKLLYAIRSCQVDRVKELFQTREGKQFKLDINAPIGEFFQRPALHHAVLTWGKEEKDKIEIIKSLVSAGGADVNVIHDGKTPADVAATPVLVNTYNKLKKLGGKIHKSTRDIVNKMAGQPWVDKKQADNYALLRKLVQETALMD
ncbi:MAG: ankyrin repeat domain-containing protein [Holosporales bacterium]|jgi:ankyrin repeat protein|nr:ankyrin repeat domain-containing protein [Holosporales bacterium]